MEAQVPWWLPYLNSIGPVGVFALVGWFIWLRYGKKSLFVNGTQASEWHLQNRDLMKDTNRRLMEIGRFQERELEYLSNVVSASARFVEIVEGLKEEIEEMKNMIRARGKR